jgi:hypothetical protein
VHRIRGDTPMTKHRLPAPQAQAFVVCREIWENPRTNEVMLAGPRSHMPIPEFPADLQVSVFAHVTGGHGTYPMEFVLRGPDGEPVWQWTPDDLLDHEDPLTPQQLIFHDLVIHVPRAGRYELALLAGGEEIGRQPLLIGPASALLG